MCEDCGCGKPGPTRIDGQPAETVASPLLSGPGDTAGSGPSPGHGHGPEPDHSHPHDHEPGHSHAHHHTHDPRHGADATSGHHTLVVQQPVLAANDRIAERNRGFFKALGVITLNVVSSPGSGKTTFIQQTLQRLGSRLRTGVIVGDLETDNDARRFRAVGARAVQVTTGTLCHLEAGMIARALSQLDCRALDLIIIENVGNLVCPASFDLGEDLRVVLLSVTEGEDKPRKYPPIFHSARVVVVNKTDLADACEFDRDLALANIRRVSPHALVFEVSAKTGAGMEAWCDFLVAQKSGAAPG